MISVHDVFRTGSFSGCQAVRLLLSAGACPVHIFRFRLLLTHRIANPRRPRARSLSLFGSLDVPCWTSAAEESGPLGQLKPEASDERGENHTSHVSTARLESVWDINNCVKRFHYVSVTGRGQFLHHFPIIPAHQIRVFPIQSTGVKERSYSSPFLIGRRRSININACPTYGFLSPIFVHPLIAHVGEERERTRLAGLRRPLEVDMHD